MGQKKKNLKKYWQKLSKFGKRQITDLKTSGNQKLDKMPPPNATWRHLTVELL